MIKRSRWWMLMALIILIQAVPIGMKRQAAGEDANANFRIESKFFGENRIDSGLFRYLKERYPKVHTPNHVGGIVVLNEPTMIGRGKRTNFWRSDLAALTISQMGNEVFYHNGDIAYCFDMFTGASGNRQYLKDFKSAGILGITEDRAAEIAHVAKALTADDFALIKQEADRIGLNDQARALLKDTGFRWQGKPVNEVIARILTQLLVYTQAHGFELGAAGYYTGDGQVVGKEDDSASGGGTIHVTPINTIFDFNRLWAIGKAASAASGEVAAYRYTLAYRVPKVIKGEEAEAVYGVYQEKGTLGDGIEVHRHAKTGEVTLISTADRAGCLPAQTSHNQTRSISASSPYGHGGQLLVDVGQVKTVRVEICTERAVGEIRLLKLSDFSERISPAGEPDKYAPKPEPEITFQLFDEAGALIGTQTTDAHGRLSFSGLHYGKYRLHQVNTGQTKEHVMLLPAEDMTVTVDDTHRSLNLEVHNRPNLMRLQVQKIDRDTQKAIHQAGVTFQIRDEDGHLVTLWQRDPSGELTPVDTLTTDEQGIAQSVERLIPGTYSLEEVKAPTGYYLSNIIRYYFDIPQRLTEENREEIITLSVDGGTEQGIAQQIENTPQYGRLQIDKRGERFVGWEEAQITVPIKSPARTETVEVEVPRAGEQLILTGYPTGADGVSTGEQTVESLSADEQGRYDCAAAPGRYRLTDSTGAAVGEWQIDGPDGRITGRLAPKTRTDTRYIEGGYDDVPFTVHRPKYECERLEGARFELRAKGPVDSYDGQTRIYSDAEPVRFATEAIFNEEGGLIYEKGDAISYPKLSTAQLKATSAELVSDRAPLQLSRIPLGDYELVETSAPAGYLKQNEPAAITFTPKAQIVRWVSADIAPIVNARQRLTARLDHKTVAATDYFGRGGYEAVRFGLYTAEAIGTLPKDGLVDVLTPDDTGVLTATDIPEGKYYFREISTENGYALDEAAYTVEMKSAEASTPERVETTQAESINRPVTHTVQLVKVDSRSGRPVSGVSFRLWAVRPDGSKVEVAPETGTGYLTDESGRVSAEHLPEGNYAWEEIGAADGYHRDGALVNVAVASDADLQVRLINTPTQLGFRKYDAQSGKPVIGARLALFDDQGCPVYLDETDHVTDVTRGRPAEWVSGSDFFNIYGLSIGAGYELRELSSPDGYASGEPVVFTVSASTGIQLVGMANRRTSLIISKRDSVSGKAVIGAHLQLFEQGAETPFLDPETGKAAEWVTDDADGGAWTVHGVEVGKTYELRETLTPAGYIPMTARRLYAVRDTEEAQRWVITNDPIPQIETSAGFVGQIGRRKTAQGSAVVLDDVKLDGVVPGGHYTLKGQLVLMDTGEAISECEQAFTPKTSKHHVQMRFPAIELSSGHVGTLVVFEALYRDGQRIAEHRDPSDEKQTLIIEPTAASKPEAPRTGDGMSIWGCVFILSAAGLWHLRRRDHTA